MENLERLHVPQLRNIARNLKIKGCYIINKENLIKEIEKFTDEESIKIISKVIINDKYICVHGKCKYFCKECGGSRICEHDRIKYFCKKCKGSQICKHDRVKYNCKECGGSQICEHGKQKQQCKDCGGSQICEHGKQKSSCKECRKNKIKIMI